MLAGWKLRGLWAVISIFVAVLLIMSSSSQAASVYSCSKNGKKCIIKLQEGLVGDYVRIIDEKAQIVGRGRIIRIKMKNDTVWGLIHMKSAQKSIRPGYPVIIEQDSEKDQNQWATSFY